MFPSYFYLIQQPKDSSFSVGDVCAIFALVISIVAPIASHYISKRNAVKETFWMREILIPHFSSILFNFVKESPGKYLTSQNLGAFYQDYALGVINSLRTSSIVLGVSSDKLKKELQEHIGDFEDDIMGVQNKDDYTQLLSEFTREVVLSIQKAQFGA